MVQTNPGGLLTFDSRVNVTASRIDRPPVRLELFPLGLARLYSRYLRSLGVLAAWLKVERSAISRTYHEFLVSRPFGRRLRPLRETDQFKAAILYILCRYCRPRRVVETGVASGFSSVGILTALEANAFGELHSIDLPAARYQTDTGQAWKDVSSAAGPGWRIPPRLKSRWSLHVGPSHDVLPAVLAELDSIDLFYHDSEHTRLTMDMEFSHTWHHLSPRGVVVADNTNWSTSFPAFCSRHDLSSIMLFPFVGLARRRELDADVAD